MWSPGSNASSDAILAPLEIRGKQSIVTEIQSVGEMAEWPKATVC